jgi:hypothetical protein
MSDVDRFSGSFGFDPSDGRHHFAVIIPESGRPGEVVRVLECPRFIEGMEVPANAVERVEFSSSSWGGICEPVRAVFNLRLKENKRKPGKWHTGVNYLAPHYGKELVLLGWGLEDAPADRTDAVFKNWRGLAPEERWWLYSTANAPFSHNSRKGRGIGWRKALSIALSENPLIELPGESGYPSIPSSNPAPTDSTKEMGAILGAKPRKKKSPATKGLSPQGGPEESQTTYPTQQTMFNL